MVYSILVFAMPDRRTEPLTRLYADTPLSVDAPLELDRHDRSPVLRPV
jgi:hypothetical protein